MALTRANVETILLKRAGGLVGAVGLDNAGGTPNADLNDPIGWAIRQLGLTVDDLTSVDNDDVARVGESEYDQFLDLAHLRLLENALDNYDATDITVGPRSEKFDQLGKRLQAAVARQQAKVERLYGTGLGALEGGVISLGFIQQYDT